MADTKEILDIILITYNRKAFLQETCRQILADNSPIKDCAITVLDNCSTDGTSEYLADLAAKHKNIRHIRHNRNIGGNANIARAFEYPNKKYFWILCDDDSYDFAHWPKVLDAMEKDFDLIVINTEGVANKSDVLKFMRRLSFLPSSVFKTDIITESVMRNIYDNIPNWFPHLAATIEVINKNGRIKILSENIVLQTNKNNDGYRGDVYKLNLSPKAKNMFFDVGYLNSLEMINDPQKRIIAVDNFALGKSFFKDVKNTFKHNRIKYNNYPRNIHGPRTILNLRQTLLFDIAILFDDICYFCKYPKYYFRRKKDEKIHSKNILKKEG